ncbi:hypothetical protein RCL1_005104 [Eukaryota sp. TZLM3-RCL]
MTCWLIAQKLWLKSNQVGPLFTDEPMCCEASTSVSTENSWFSLKSKSNSSLSIHDTLSVPVSHGRRRSLPDAHSPISNFMSRIFGTRSASPEDTVSLINEPYQSLRNRTDSLSESSRVVHALTLNIDR